MLAAGNLPNPTAQSRRNLKKSLWERRLQSKAVRYGPVEVSASIRVVKYMRPRLTSLLLVLMLAGSASAGLPLPFSADECDMHQGANCSKVARTLSTTPEIANAKLCCVLSCPQNGTTSPPNVVRVTSTELVRASAHPAVTNPMPVPALLIRHIDRLHGPPTSKPAYLRNLSLLI